MESNYLTSAQKANQLPPESLAEIAFIGRSNCGKSSLLNSLLERKNLAKSSSTPGRTQMVNFFSVKLKKDQEFLLVDLPGYGFNSAAKSVAGGWDDLTTAYLQRGSLRVCVFISDSRRSLEDFEVEWLKQLAEVRELVVAFTKIDKLSAKELAKRRRALDELALPAETYWISNSKGTGITALRDRLWASVAADGEELPPTPGD